MDELMHCMIALRSGCCIVQNPFDFKHITQLNGPRELDDSGSCVVLATPSMLQVLYRCHCMCMLSL